MYKCHNILLEHDFDFKLNKDFHHYNTRNRNSVRKSQAHCRWGHWTTLNFAAIVLNNISMTIRDTASLSIFKKRVSKLYLVN
jgi:hypothetical protein